MNYLNETQPVCLHCKSIIIASDDELQVECSGNETLTYFNLINRGGLKHPSDLLVDICSSLYCLFQVLISEHYECEFLKVKYQRDTVIKLGMQMCELCFEDLENVCECGLAVKSLIQKILKTLSNIYINNYCKNLNSKLTSQHIAKKLAKKRSAKQEKKPTKQEKFVNLAVHLKI